VRWPKGMRGTLQGIDAVPTNKGFFYKYPFARLRKVRGKNQWRLEIVPPARRGPVEYTPRRDVFHPMPNRVSGDIREIGKWVDGLIKHHGKPDNIRWSIADRRESPAYIPENFGKYFGQWLDEDREDLEALEQDIIAGYDPTIDDFNGDRNALSEYYRRRKFYETAVVNSDFYNGVFFVYYPKAREQIKQRKKKPKKKV